MQDQGKQDELKPITHMPRDYDLSNELGLKNKYDRLAGKAILASRKYKDLRLVDMGTRLGKLIRTIPYDDDRFYKVIAAAKSIETRIDELNEMEKFEKEKFLIKYGEYTEPTIFSFGTEIPIPGVDEKCDNPLSAYISVGNFNIQEENEKARKIQEEVESFIMEDAEIDLNKLISVNKSYRELGSTSSYESFFDMNNNLVVEFYIHQHEKDGNFGQGLQTFFFFKSLKQAKNIWNKIKNNFDPNFEDKKNI